MTAAERFMASYNDPTRRPPRGPSAPARALRLRKSPRPDPCGGCGTHRAPREAGWWEHSVDPHGVYWHYRCVTDEMLAAHEARWPTGGSLRDKVRRHRAAKRVP